MPRLNSVDKMAALLKKQEEIAAELKQLKAREKQTERKADTRRKVIAGALALEHLAKHPDSEFARVLSSLLDNCVEERSRYLFPFLPKRDGSQPAGRAPDAAPAPPGAPSMAAAARATTRAPVDPRIVVR
jgi:hypothetical protein